MAYFDSRDLFLNREELSIASHPDTLSRRAINFEVFAPYVSGKKILDVGCCDGRWSAWMLDHGATHVHGIDISDVYINDGALAIMPNYFSADAYSFEVADIFLFEPTTQFDAVGLFSVLYFEKPYEMIRKVCSIANMVLVDITVDTIVCKGGTLDESEMRQQFATLGYEITDLQPQQPFLNRVMFVATRTGA